MSKLRLESWTLILMLPLMTMTGSVRSGKQYSVFRNKDVKVTPSTLNYFTSFLIPPIKYEVRCITHCMSIDQPLRLCSAVSYNKGASQCLEVLACPISQLVSAPGVTAYVLQSAIYSAQRPNLFFPLSANCMDTSIGENYGTDSVAVPPTLCGDLDFIGTDYPVMNSTLLFPAASMAFPAANYVIIDGISGTDIFGSSFTISFFFMAIDTKPGQPLIEFLGATLGSMCATIRLSCNGSCVSFIYNQACDCSIEQAPLINASFDYQPQQWVHFTIIYGNDSQILQTYINGKLFDSVNVALPALQTPVTRAQVGATECDGYSGFYNSLAGSFGCLQVYKSALDYPQIVEGYQTCTSSAIVFI